MPQEDHDIYQTNEAVYESEERYGLFFKNSPDAAIILVDGFIVDCNLAAEAVLRGDRDQILGKTPADFSPDFQPDGKRSDEAAKDKITEALQSGNNIFEWQHRRLDGTDFWVEVSISSIKANGRSILYVAWRDISERKRAEIDLQNERTLFRTIIDLIPDAVYVKDTEGRKIFANPKEVIFSGKNSEDEIIGKTDFSLYLDIDAKHAKEEDQFVLETGNSILGIESQKTDRNGDDHWYLGSKVPLRDIYGTISGIVGVTHDITGQKKYEHALMESEANFRTFFETMDDLIMIGNDQGELYYVNNAFIKKLGFGLEEPKRMDTPDYQIHNTKWEAERVFGEMIVGREYSHRLPLSLKDGTIVPMETRIWSGKWDGKDCMFSISKDLSKEQESLQKFNKIFDNNPALMAISSIPEKIFTEVNQVFLSKTGYSREEVIGKSAGQISLFVDPEKQLEIAAELERKGYIRNCELRVNTKMGNIMVGLFSGEIIENLGKKHFLTVMVDITENKQLEEEVLFQNNYYNIVATISEKLIQADSYRLDFEIDRSLEMLGGFSKVDRGYIFELDAPKDEINNTFEWCACGIASEIGHLQKIPFSYIPLSKEKFLRNEHVYIESVIDLPNEVHYELDILGSHGVQSLVTVPMYYGSSLIGFIGFDSVVEKKRWNENVITLLKIYANVLAGVINKKKIEATLLKAKEEADIASKFKSEFLANMSHEIRTPLNGVIGFTDLLLKTPLNKIQMQYAENVNTSGHSLLGIINDILDFSKIEAGKMELDFIKTDIIELTEQCSDIIKYHTSQKGIEFLLNIQPDMPRFIFVDPQRIKQILINLLSNAVKFTDNGEIELKVSFAKKDAISGYFSFMVRDTGIGISQEQQTKLFKAFVQADASITRKFGGTGLGLTISNMLAEKLGSKIEVQSDYGKGANFSFTLETEYEFGEKPDKGNLEMIKQVLVIDDNDNNRLILEHSFNNWGIGFTGVDNGLAALKIIEKSTLFDVIIVDYHMPYLNGLETIRMVREKLLLTPDRQPVILLHSSSDDIQIFEECKKLGVKFNLVKPVKSHELLHYLNNIHSNTAPEVKEAGTGPSGAIADISGNVRPVILIAEDVFMNMLLIRTFVRQIVPKAEIFEAKTGKEALELAKKIKPDLIFMDVQMPEMSGLEATVGIREHEMQTGGHIPIVALTAGAIKQEKENCIEAGMDDFLTKPIDNNALQIILKKFLTTLN